MQTRQDRTRQSTTGATAISVLIACVISTGIATAAPAVSDAITTQVSKLTSDAESAEKSGNLNLAKIELQNAAQLAPTNGGVRAHLGEFLMRTGQAVAAERELRQARNDYGPEDEIVPVLLKAMLQRNEFKELLAEFPDPSQGTRENTTADVLNARAIALQFLGQPAQARAAMDRSVALRRDADGLLASAELAEQQADLALAQRQIDEAIKVSPADEDAWKMKVRLGGRSGDLKKALASADDFVQHAPKSAIAKVMRIEVLLQTGANTRAQQETNALLKDSPDSPYGPYLRGVVLWRAKDFKGAWEQIRSLPLAFMQSDVNIAPMVASIAESSGNAEIAGSVLTTLTTTHPELRDPRLQLASLRLNQNSAQSAVDILAPLASSMDPEVHALLAQAYLMLRRFDLANSSFEIANGSQGASDLLKQQMAMSELQMGDPEQAVRQFREVLQREPRNAAVAEALIFALMRISKWDEALAIADGLAKQAPRSTLPPLYRGQILLERGSLAEATAEFNKALELDPKFTPALYFRAKTSLLRGDTEAAKKDLQLLLAQNPIDMLAYIKLTQIAASHGQQQDALATLNAAIKAAPKNPTPRFALANYLTGQRKYQDALTAVNGLLQLSPADADALALKARILFFTGKTADAIMIFRDLVASNGNSPVALVLLARALAETKDQAGAEESAKRAIALAPDSVDLQKELIDIEAAGGKGDLALENARNFVKAYPGVPADLLLADALVRLNRANEAETLLDKSLAAKPDARLALRLSEVAITLGDVKKANAVLADWVAKNPNDLDTRTIYAAMMTQAGDPAAGRREYEAVLKQRPNDAVVLNNLAVLLQKDDPARALSMVTQAANIAPDSAEIVDTLGWLKFQYKDQQGALPLLQRAHELAPDNGAMSYHLAIVLNATGKRPEARQLLQSALAKTPKFEGADEARQVLTHW